MMKKNTDRNINDFCIDVVSFKEPKNNAPNTIVANGSQLAIPNAIVADNVSDDIK